MQTIKNLDGRQHSDWLYVEIDLADFLAQPTPNVVEFEVPPNSEVVGGHITVTDTFNDSGTDTLAIGDPTTANRYLAATTLKTAARTAIVPTGFLYGVDGTVQKMRLTRAAQNANGTKGTVRVAIEYVRLNRAYHSQG